MVTVTHHRNQIGTGLKKNDSNTISSTLHVSGMDFNKSNQIYSHVSHRQLNENSTKHSFLYIVHVCAMDATTENPIQKISVFKAYT